MEGLPAKKTFRIVHFDEDTREQQRVLQELAGKGLPCEMLAVKTDDEFREVVKNATLDLILCDFHSGRLGGLNSLIFAKKVRPEVPFVLMGNHLDGKQLSEAMNLGAADYVPKGRMEYLSEAGRGIFANQRPKDETRDLEAGETSTRGIVHDLNNALGSIIAYANLAKMDAGDNRVLTDNISEVLKASHRARALARQLSTAPAIAENTPPHSPDAAGPAGSGERILVLDDELSLTDATAQLLQRLGYRVSAETDPLRALDLFRRQPENYDLILTDLTMPKMSGVEWAAQVLKMRPGIPVLVTTAYSPSRLNREALQKLGIKELIIKPVSPPVLAALHTTGSEPKTSSIK